MFFYKLYLYLAVVIGLLQLSNSMRFIAVTRKPNLFLLFVGISETVFTFISILAALLFF